MNRSTVTAAAVPVGLAAAAALVLAAPAIAENVSRASGELTRYPNQAITGSTAPEGATARVQRVGTGDGRTVVTLKVSGMERSAAYGAHAHVAACGEPGTDTAGLAAGPHFQHAQDPVTPSTDAAFANPQNEIWLDLTTNHAGNGHATSVVEWQFEPARRPKSVIIHEMHTLTTEGKHGVAGKRVACIDVPF
jgi:Cu-Zn family superoxide dismutase